MLVIKYNIYIFVHSTVTLHCLEGKTYICHKVLVWKIDLVANYLFENGIHLNNRSGRQLDEARLFSMVCSNGTRSNGQKLEHRKFQINMWRTYLQWGWWSPRTGSLERLWVLLWRYSRLIWSLPTQPTAGNLLELGVGLDDF